MLWFRVMGYLRVTPPAYHTAPRLQANFPENFYFI